MIILSDRGFCSTCGTQISFLSTSLPCLGTWAKNRPQRTRFHLGSPSFKWNGKFRKKFLTKVLHQTEWSWKLTGSMFTLLIRTRLLSKWERGFSDHPKWDSLCLQTHWEVAWPSQVEHQQHLRENNILHLAASFFSPAEINASMSISPPPLCSSTKSKSIV